MSIYFTEAAAVHYEKDEALKAKRHEEYTKDVYPDLLSKLDKVVTKNNGHLALSKVWIRRTLRSAARLLSTIIL